ncbi:MAG: hypothetical protein MUC60_08705 [Oscillatoria sp. Prado101]|nr:hypothetical protein [Oscillatoria sp. Prado101]
MRELNHKKPLIVKGDAGRSLQWAGVRPKIKHQPFLRILKHNWGVAGCVLEYIGVAIANDAGSILPFLATPAQIAPLWGWGRGGFEFELDI